MRLFGWFRGKPKADKLSRANIMWDVTKTVKEHVKCINKAMGKGYVNVSDERFVEILERMWSDNCCSRLKFFIHCNSYQIEELRKHFSYVKDYSYDTSDWRQRLGNGGLPASKEEVIHYVFKGVKDEYDIEYPFLEDT